MTPKVITLVGALATVLVVFLAEGDVAIERHETEVIFAVLAQMDYATALCAAESFARVLTRIDFQMLRSLTYGQGREMAAHERFSQETGMVVHFAHPHSP